MSACLFCKILHGTIPATKVYEDDATLAFRDIAPQAPHHILLIHKEHYATLHEVPEERVDAYYGALMRAAQKIVAQEGLTDSGYRMVFNSGRDGQQTVDHIHLHILGGRSMHWPPG